MSHFTIRSGLAAGVLAGGLVLSGCHGGSQPVTAAPPASPATVATGSAPTSAPPVAPKPATTIAGTLLYRYVSQSGSDKDRLVRLRGSRTTTILTGDGVYAAELSPDGKRIAYIDTPDAGFESASGSLMVAKSDGTGARRLRSNVVTPGFGPSWSPDGTRLAIATYRDQEPDTWTKGTVRVSDKKFVALPKSLQDGIRYRFSGDGRRYFYQDGQCRVLSAKVDGTDIRTVPVLGDEDSSKNPRRQRACDLISVNHDGSRVTVDLVVGNGTNGDIGGSQQANAVVETATGKVRAIPVGGKIKQALYRTDGRLLVSSEKGGKRTLTLFSPDDQVLATMSEPASVKELELHDYAG